ncbi:hypothetical protein A7X97_04075 [Stenotrophomonas sepilia]|uniref:hypothetical protein n=1 Tax=Stenotrophomonas sepilia TaxID=2860290 RepID=UPI000DAA91B6|nr:hypothetical protein [Stenotrophomonas sepilia]ELK6802905.1 hypothetical protein [Stenotrophomonas maltophilia]MDJ1624127.1 hypothetical protein [Stenotrophomonas sepilia]PZT41274.1 hypothetical protein A7X97_04075 [Stenotrophomonas sepilia]
MTTDKKTLADVKPGGRVRLGDQADGVNPTAQAVDLERFRGTVKSQYSMTEWMHRCGFVSAEKPEESKKNHDYLMALIDSQAVGNG